MKLLKFLICLKLVIIANNLFAQTESNFLSNLFQDRKGKLYSITTDITSVIVDRKYTGISQIEINSENID